MEELTFKNAYYIKLGKEAEWVEECLRDNIIRIGWSAVKNVEDINNGNWETIKEIINWDFKKEGKKNGATQDFNALRFFCDATHDDIFITFYNGFMYWCTSTEKTILEKTTHLPEKTARYRQCNGWSNKPLGRGKKAFHVNDLSGNLTKTQGFRGTICKLKEDQVNILKRLINGKPNEDVAKIQTNQKEIICLIEKLNKHLHPKDCEILADLIFQRSGWQRISILGENMPFIDMEYFDPITNTRYAVQVKASCTLDVFNSFVSGINSGSFDKGFFIVFDSLNEKIFEDQIYPKIEIISGQKLANLIFDLGLLNWIMKKSY